MTEEWVSVNDRLPEIDYTKPEYERRVKVLASWSGYVAEMNYVSNGFAKTEKGRIPRFEWFGRVSPFDVTHWMPMPAPPSIDNEK